MSSTENIKGLLKNKGTRSVILVTLGALAFFVAIAFVVLSSKPEPLPHDIQGVATGAPPDMAEHDTKLGASPRHEQLVHNVQSMMADKAEETGGSAQPLREPTPVNVDPQKQAPPQTQYANPQVAPQFAHNVPNPQQDAAYANALARGNEAALTTLQRSGPKMPAVVAFDRQPAPTAQSAAVQPPVAQTSGAPSVSNAASGPLPMTLIHAGAIYAIKTDIATNTKVGGPIVATILDGPMAGGRLVGTVQRADVVAKHEFRLLSLPGKGISVPVEATSLDSETMSVGAASEVDRHLLTKYVLKPTASALSAIGQAAGRANTTVTVGIGGVTESRGSLTSDEKRAIMIGGASQQIQADVNAMDTEPTVKVHKGEILGVVFLKDVVYTPPR